MKAVPRGGANAALKSYAEVLDPTEAVEPILARPVRAALMEWLQEIWAERELKAVGLQPRQRALFYGPPGTGKTTLAHHLAARLGLPLAIARSDRLIDSWIGSTGRNIGALFDAAAATPCVLFIDEADSIMQKRTAAQQGADTERNGSVNVVLACLERHKGVVIAATNRMDQLDEAVWRRFQIQIGIDLPGQGECRLILKRYLAPYVLEPEDLDMLASAVSGASPALMRQLCEGIKRQLVVGPRVKWDMAKDAVWGRLLVSIAPHPDLDLPRLWRMKTSDPALASLPWPLTVPAKEASARPARAA